MKINTISFFFRSKGIDYSIERVFDSIIPKLPSNVVTKRLFVPHNFVKAHYVLKNLWYCRKHKSDINHVTGVIHYCTFALPYAKTVITIHDMISVEQGKGIKKFFFWLFFFYLPIKSCKYVTCISDSVKDSLIKHKCCSSSKIVVIPNPVSDSFIHIPKAFNTENPRILHIGTRPNKNLPNVIEALDSIQCHLIIVGKIESPELQLLKKYNIQFTNKFRLSDDEILQEYIDCDIISFPSLFEGFGLPIIEGQAVGRPVLTSSISPMKEVAGDNYYLVNPTDIKDIKKGFLSLIHDADLRSNLITEGLINVQKYRTAVVVKKYMELYSEILNNTKK